MIELGNRKDLFGTELLKPLDVRGRPKSMPFVPAGCKVICGYDQGLGERMFVCETTTDMQELYDAYARGGALQIRWYSGEDPGFITIL